MRTSGNVPSPAGTMAGLEVKKSLLSLESMWCRGSREKVGLPAGTSTANLGCTGGDSCRQHGF